MSIQLVQLLILAIVPSTFPLSPYVNLSALVLNGEEAGPAVLQGACENRLRGHMRCICVCGGHLGIITYVCVSLSGSMEMTIHQLG